MVPRQKPSVEERLRTIQLKKHGIQKKLKMFEHSIVTTHALKSIQDVDIVVTVLKSSELIEYQASGTLIPPLGLLKTGLVD